MKKTSIAVAALLACIALPVLSVGEEVESYSDMLAQLERLEAQLQSQQVQFSTASHAMGGAEAADVGCGDCFDPGRKGGFYALYENVVVQPFFTRSTAYYLEDPGAINGQVEVPFNFDFSYSPRIEIGRICDCGEVGFRGRYWYFDDETTLNATAPGNDIYAMFADDSTADIGIDGVNAATFRHSLQMHVVDVEAAFRQCNWTYAAGIRYAGMDQRYSGDEVGGGDRVVSEHNFDGWGVTLGAEVVQPWRGGLSLFAKARGAVLYGKSGLNAFNPDSPDDRIVYANSGDLLAIGELQVGIDWRRTLESGRVWFVTLALESQYWANAGTGGPGSNAVFDEGNYQNSNPLDADLGFFGANLGLGLLF